MAVGTYRGVKVADSLGLTQVPRMDVHTVRTLLAEFIATFTFLFIALGSGAMQLAADNKDPVVAGIAVGFAAVAVIYSFGGMSGAHFNPAVTFGSIVGLRMNVVKGVMYMAMQLLAAFAATGLLMYLYPNMDLANQLTLAPTASIGRAVLIEAIMTFFLVMTIYATALGKAPTVSKKRELEEESAAEHEALNRDALLEAGAGAGSSKEARLTREVLDEEPAEAGTYDPNKPFAGLAIGLMLGTLCYVGGQLSGGAFNPARATAPAVLARNWGDLWIYWLGDFVGAALAGTLYNVVLSG
jgi:glycerol uptake facilitator-like aquaporin